MAASTVVVATSTKMAVAGGAVSAGVHRRATTVAGAFPRSRDGIARVPTTRHRGGHNVFRGRGRRDVARPRAAILSPFAPPDASPKRKHKKKLRLRIDDVWYDCTGWAKAHPGGSLFISLMDGCDATDVFYALHSYGPNGDDTAARRLAMLPTCLAPGVEEEKGRAGEQSEEGEELVTASSSANAPAPMTTTRHTHDNKPGEANPAFASLRRKFEEQGWFARDPLKEASVLAQVMGLYGVGWFLAGTHPVMAAVLLGLGMQQAGWLAHDYIHGRGPWCAAMRWFGALTNGFSTEWWQHKHNMHHAFTNIDGRDGDIKLEPLYYLSDPAVTGRRDNKGLRRWQHLYGYPLYALTYVLWRRHSVASAVRRRDKKEGLLLALHYAWLFVCIPPPVAVASVLLGGFLVGALVTATHQTEEIMFEQNGEYVDVQFRSTREADVRGLERWLWGGMDTQLVHHLFPTMPRYRHHEARPIIQAWAEEHGYDFRISSSKEILSKNFNHLKELAHI